MDIKQLELNWYLKKGLYSQQRIAKDNNGILYVIGDFSWNRKYPYHQEYIEEKMKEEIKRINQKNKSMWNPKENL